MSKKLSSGGRGKRRFKRIAGKFFVLLLVLVVYTLWQLWDINRVGFTDEGRKADCAIVLGAAAYYNKPSPVFRARIDHAIDLYKSGRVGKLVLTGGFGEKAEFAESEVAYAYCKKRGVPAEDLLVERESKTTEQNVIQAKKLMEDNAMVTALLVSDPWHLKRALAMAGKHEVEAEASATQTSMYRSEKSQWGFLLREFYYLHVWRFAGE